MSNEIVARPQINVKMYEDLDDKTKKDLDDAYIGCEDCNSISYGSSQHDGFIMFKKMSSDELMHEMRWYYRCETCTIYIHHSVENPIQVKKKIESILSLKVFW